MYFTKNVRNEPSSEQNFNFRKIFQEFKKKFFVTPSFVDENQKFFFRQNPFFYRSNIISYIGFGEFWNFHEISDVKKNWNFSENLKVLSCIGLQNENSQNWTVFQIFSYFFHIFLTDDSMSVKKSQNFEKNPKIEKFQLFFTSKISWKFQNSLNPK